MKAQDIICYNLSSAAWVWKELTSDLSDDDLFVRISPGANHLAWQWGHVLAANRRMLEGVAPGSAPPFPKGFEEAHSKDTVDKPGREGFLTKDEYAEVTRAQVEASLAAMKKLSDADLERPHEGPMKDFAPTHAALLAVQGLHMMWHLGQVTALRRYLNKPVKF